MEPETGLHKILPSASQRLAFFVGAGISVDYPSGLPLAEPFMKAVVGALTTPKRARRFYPDRQRGEKPIVTPPPRFEFVLQLIKEYVDPKLHLLECYAPHRPKSTQRGAVKVEQVDNSKRAATRYEPKPNFAHHVLATFLLHGHYLLTTNFDHLLEDALHAPDQKREWLGQRVYAAAQYRTIARQLRNGTPVPPGLYKLHGTKERPQTLGVTFDRIHFEKDKAQLLRSVLERADLYVAGYSGTDDFDILPALAQVDAPDRRVVWVVHDNDPTEPIVVYGGTEGRSLVAYEQDPRSSPEGRAIQKLLMGWVSEGKRAEQNVYLVCGFTRQFLRDIHTRMFGELSGWLRELYELPDHTDPQTNWGALIKSHIRPWAQETLRTKLFAARIWATEFMWVQNVAGYYLWAWRELRRAASKRDPIEMAMVKRDEAWLYSIPGPHRRMLNKADEAYRALWRHRGRWLPALERRELRGELAFEALIDALHANLEGCARVGDASGVRKATRKVDAIAARFNLARRRHRARKTMIDILMMRANFASSRGNLAEGYAWYRRATKLYRELGEYQWEAYAQGGIADFLRVTGRFEQALREYKSARRRIELLGGTWFDGWFIAAFLDLQRYAPAAMSGSNGVPVEAGSAEVRMDLVHRAISELEKIKDPEPLSLAYRWRGDLARKTGQFDAAQMDYTRSKWWARELGSKENEYATTLCEAAGRLQLVRDTRRAAERLKQDVESLKRKCQARGLALESAHGELILAELERIEGGWSARFERCLTSYGSDEMQCYWGELMALAGLELGERVRTGAQGLARCAAFAKKHELNWAKGSIEEWSAWSGTSVQQPREFYFPLFN